jgi:hypothetical protein
LNKDQRSINSIGGGWVGDGRQRNHITDFQPKPSVMDIGPFGASPEKYRDGATNFFFFFLTCGTSLDSYSPPPGIAPILRFYHLAHQKNLIAGMTADSDRHLACFERVSPLTLSMGIAADLGIALVISKSSSSKARD